MARYLIFAGCFQGPIGGRGRPVKPIINMKTSKLIITLSAVAVAAFVAGCGDAKPKAGEPGAESSSPGTGAGTTLKDTANQTVDAAKETAAAVAEQARVAATNAAAQVKTAAATATAEAQKAVAAAKTTATTALADATKQADSAKTSVTAQAQALIDKAKVLVTEKKYQDALASLQQLTGFQLTTEQQKMVADLKTTIQSALNSEAGKAVQGLFK